MNFAMQTLKTMGSVILAGSLERALKIAQNKKMDARTLQLWLALTSLAFASSFLLYFLVPWLSPLLFLFSRLSSGEAPPAWIFWLGESSWTSLAFGFLIGALIRIFLRFSWLIFLVTAGLLLSGIASLGTAWGIFLGGFLSGALENFWRYSRKEFRLRLGIALAFGLGGLLCVPLTQVFLSQFSGGSYSAQLRWFQWILMVSVFLFMETITSLFFFHFYYARSQKLTKV